MENTTNTNPWELYDRLIDGVPEGIAVRDYSLGLHWTYLADAASPGP